MDSFFFLLNRFNWIKSIEKKTTYRHHSTAMEQIVYIFRLVYTWWSVMGVGVETTSEKKTDDGEVGLSGLIERTLGLSGRGYFVFCVKRTENARGRGRTRHGSRRVQKESLVNKCYIIIRSCSCGVIIIIMIMMIIITYCRGIYYYYYYYTPSSSLVQQ